MDMPRNYLAIFVLPTPHAEHGSIRTTLERISSGDCKQAFITGGALGFVFATRLQPHEIIEAVTLFARDSALVVEIDGRFTAINLNVTSAWLKKHLPQR